MTIFNFQNFVVVQSTSTTSSGSWSVSCNAGLNVISCGMYNSQYSYNDEYRGLYPSSSTYCTCFDRNGVACNSRCTTVPASNFAMMKGSGTSFNVMCPASYSVVGCHAMPWLPANSVDYFRYTYPLAGGKGCYCKDNGGFDCWASCAINITNYEIQWSYSSGYSYASCTYPKNFVLGCTFVPVQSGSNPFFKFSYAITDTMCLCYTNQEGACYAICGTL